MNILFVSAVFPYPLYSGGQVRIYNLLKRLGNKHTIILCTFIRDEAEKKYIPQLPFCSAIHTIYRGKAWQPGYIAAAAFSKYPFLYCTYSNSAMSALIQTLVKKNAIDIVHIEPGYVWPSIPKLSVPLVVGEHNIEHEVYQLYAQTAVIPFIKPILNLDIRKMKVWEDRIWNHATRIVTVSKNDATYISGRTEKPIQIVPNGVDVSVLRFNPRRRSDGVPVVLFVGNFSWLQNRDALKFILDEIWPILRGKIANIQLRIVGRGMSAEMRKRLDSGSVHLEEHAEDIVSEFHAADVLVAPIRIGGGTKFKILEAMACGLPVITGSLGISGISCRANHEYLEAESPVQFVDAVQSVLTDDVLRARIQKNARTLVERDYNWNTIATALDKAWNDTYEQSQHVTNHHHR